MVEPDTTAYYLLLFGASVLGPIMFVAAAVAFISSIFKRSRRLASIGLALLLCLGVIVFIHPVSNLFIFTNHTEAKIATMQAAAREEGYIGKSIKKFTARFGQPDATRALKGRNGSILYYRCRPWFAYGWSNLAVYTNSGNVEQIVIDD